MGRLRCECWWEPIPRWPVRDERIRRDLILLMGRLHRANVRRRSNWQMVSRHLKGPRVVYAAPLWLMDEPPEAA